MPCDFPESQNQKIIVCDPKSLTQGECLLKFQTNENEQKCEPNAFVLNGCNICRCGLDGKVDNTLCTKHRCANNKAKTRRSNNIVGRCEPKHWYQISKCQLCYCVNKNKLICNINNSRDKVQLGPYKLYNCGENIINNLLKIVRSEETLLRSVTKKVNIKEKNTGIKTNTTVSDDTSTPIVILLNSKESVNSSKVKEDKASINMNIEIKYRNINDKDNISINIDDSFEDDSINGLNIGTLEHNEALDTKSEVLQSLVNTDSNTHVYKEVNINDLSGVDLPRFLENILSLAMRKSMVSVSSGKECKPGTSVKDGCNTCFCLTNGKTLCTKMNCE